MCTFIGERLDAALNQVEAEARAIEELNADTQASAHQKMFRRKSMVSMHGPKAYNERKVHFFIRQ